MEIKLISDKAVLEKEGEVYIIKYNPLKQKESSQVTVEISEIPLVGISARPGCASCTTTSTKIKDDKVLLTISYDTKHLGSFDKKVSFFHQEKLTTFKIRGTVTQ